MESILNLIYPKNIYCSCCGDTISTSRLHGLCDSCIKEIDWCFDNQYRFKMDEFYFDEVIACCIYGFRPKQLIQNLKLSKMTYIAEGVGYLMAERVLKDIDENASIYDYIVPVPMAKSKEEKRGFNQAALLAKYVEEKTHIKMLEKVLVKTKETPSQRLASGFERKHSMEGVFSISNGKDSILKGTSILLVDDVITTGSTVSECAKVLKKAGAESVSVLCFASAHSIGIMA